MDIIEEGDVVHYGTPRHSGRYPWGSGGNEEGFVHRTEDLLQTILHLRSKGLTDSQIAAGLNMTTTEFRAQRTIAKNAKKQADIAFAQRLRDKGVSNTAGAKQMGIPESSFRALLAPGAKDRADNITVISNMLKKEVDDNPDSIIDIGDGVEAGLHISKEKLNVAIAILKEKGYGVHVIPIPQLGTGFDTKTRVLVKPGMTQRDAFLARGNLKQLQSSSDDGGRTFSKVHDPLSLNPNRVAVRYGEDGGGQADGVMYVRPGVKDVELGQNRYAQVRILVGESHYLKGMAVYKDDLPPGVDVMFNTPKSSTGNKFDVMKPISGDPDLPFGAITHQVLADKGTPQERVTSVMNIMGSKDTSGTEGDWETWNKTLSAQFLSKQKPSLVREQLAKTYDRRRREFDEINSLTNPVVKKKLLQGFAESTDSSAVHLDSAALSARQGWHVILPVNSLKPNEVYAPRFRDGESVVLIRHPHGGTFEIPELTVNNRNREAKQLLGTNPLDAIGIHHSVAKQLSGADFDGDTVIVIPNNSRKVERSPALKQLKNFDPIASYPKYDDMHVMTKREEGIEMGKVSNLITDMTIRGAPHEDIARAVKHSMVVIDARKKELNYKQSYIDHGISQLQQKYQGKKGGGASTLISRATSETSVNERKARPHTLGGPIDKVTGEKVFVETGNTRQTKETVTKSGRVIPSKTVLKTERSQKLAETNDAFSLVSDANTPVERLYAEHSNRLKALANEARLSQISQPSIRRDASAARVFSKEVQSLEAKLHISITNRPLERQAQAIAGARVRAKRAANPDLEPETIKKLKFKALEDARAAVGARKDKRQIDITQDEWKAIQAGAISNHKLTEILRSADLQQVRQLATPRRVLLMSPGKTQEAKSLLARGFTRAQVADKLGVSLTTLDNATGPTTKE